MLLNMVMFKVTICDIGKMNINMTDKIEKRRQPLQYRTMAMTTTIMSMVRASAAMTAAWKLRRHELCRELQRITSKRATHTRRCSSTTTQTIWVAVVTSPTLTARWCSILSMCLSVKSLLRNATTFGITPYLFNAKEFDEETGMYYYGARYYEPRLSLWLSIDPKEEKYSNVSTYCYVISNPLKYTDPTGMEIDMTKVRLADEQLKLSTTQSVIKDLASQTGLQLSLDKDNKLQYAKNDEGKPIVNKITNKKGKEIDAGSKTARNFLIKMIDNKTEIEVSYHAKRTVTSGTQIGLSFEQISNMVKSAVGVDGNTLGFGMTFLHELHHTTIGGDYHDSTELFGTGPVVDNMNIIRNELNKQGFNYGERLNYKAIHTKEGNIIPFNESALTSLKYNSSMGKKAHYIKTK